MKKENELFFVGINDPADLRREILLSTKNAIQFLKKNEELSELRILKVNSIMNYKNDIKEINSLINKLKEKFPKAKVRIKSETRPKEELKIIKQNIIQKKKKSSELEKLELELSDIEKKIGRLR